MNLENIDNAGLLTAEEMDIRMVALEEVIKRTEINLKGIRQFLKLCCTKEYGEDNIYQEVMDHYLSVRTILTSFKEIFQTYQTALEADPFDYE